MAPRLALGRLVGNESLCLLTWLEPETGMLGLIIECKQDCFPEEVGYAVHYLEQVRLVSCSVTDRRSRSNSFSDGSKK
jgi:hypothetical protein